MTTERGALCPVCKVDTIRTNGAYVCPDCGRVMGFVRLAPPQRADIGGRVKVVFDRDSSRFVPIIGIYPKGKTA